MFDERVTLGKQINALTRQVAALSDRLDEAGTQAPGAANQRPPHY